MRLLFSNLQSFFLRFLFYFSFSHWEILYFISLRVKNNWIEVSRFVVSFVLFGMIFLRSFFCKCMILLLSDCKEVLFFFIMII